MKLPEIYVSPEFRSYGKRTLYDEYYIKNEKGEGREYESFYAFCVSKLDGKKTIMYNNLYGFYNVPYFSQERLLLLEKSAVHIDDDGSILPIIKSLPKNRSFLAGFLPDLNAYQISSESEQLLTNELLSSFKGNDQCLKVNFDFRITKNLVCALVPQDISGYPVNDSELLNKYEWESVEHANIPEKVSFYKVKVE